MDYNSVSQVKAYFSKKQVKVQKIANIIVLKCCVAFLQLTNTMIILRIATAKKN